MSQYDFSISNGRRWNDGWKLAMDFQNGKFYCQSGEIYIFAVETLVYAFAITDAA